MSSRRVRPSLPAGRTRQIQNDNCYIVDVGFKLKTMMEEEREFEEKPEEEKSEKNKASFFFELIKIVFFSLLIIIPIRTFLFQPFFVQGASMEPNFYDGEYLIINEFGYKKTVVGTGDYEIFTANPHKELQRGDVVVFRYPNNPDEYFIKRIVGLPEEKIEIQEGRVLVYNDENPGGKYLDEKKYLPSVAQRTECVGNCVFDLEDDEYIVLGDNRSHSSDSRRWGVLNEDFVIGKVLLRAWPLSEFKWF